MVTMSAPTACTAKECAGATGQRYEVMWYPTPDAAYAMSYQKIVLSYKLDDATPYPLGGMAHGETILASCMAVAELEKNDSIGPWNAKWIERMVASISADRNHKAQYLGYNGDRSDRPNQSFDRVLYAKLNGVLPS